MKLRYILSEDVDIQKHQAQLDAVSKRTDIPQEELINYLNEMDPNGNYTRWILKQIKFQNIRVPEDNHRVREALQQFDQNKQRLEVKDIMQYKRVSDLEDALEPVLGTGSKRKKALQYNPMALPGVEKIAEDGPFVLYHITDADSLAELGEGTRLCTRKDYPDCQAESYINNNSPIYIITKDNKLFAQVAIGTREIKDSKNNDIDITDLSYNIVRHVPYLLYMYAITAGIRIPEVESYVLADLVRVYLYAKYAIRGRWPEAEPILLKYATSTTDYDLMDYLKDVVGGRVPELEPTIIKIPKLAYYYARDVIEGRWPEAEPYIMQDPEYAYLYAKDIMNGERWLEAEPHIMQDPHWAYEYAKNIMNGERWPEAEPYIMKDAYWACVYAQSIINGPWPEAEPYIARVPQCAYHYLEKYIKAPWPEAEPYLAKEPELAIKYALYALRKPWPEAEPYIMKKPQYAYAYASQYKKDGWPEAEPYIMKDPHWAYEYAKNIMNGERWPEAEPYIMKDAYWAYMYAKNIIRGPWPEAEPTILTNPRWAFYYTYEFKPNGWPEAESHMPSEFREKLLRARSSS